MWFYFQHGAEFEWIMGARLETCYRRDADGSEIIGKKTYVRAGHAVVFVLIILGGQTQHSSMKTNDFGWTPTWCEIQSS
jgi:hypothetical protein